MSLLLLSFPCDSRFDERWFVDLVGYYSLQVIWILSFFCFSILQWCLAFTTSRKRMVTRTKFWMIFTTKTLFSDQFGRGQRSLKTIEPRWFSQGAILKRKSGQQDGKAASIPLKLREHFTFAVHLSAFRKTRSSKPNHTSWWVRLDNAAKQKGIISMT